MIFCFCCEVGMGKHFEMFSLRKLYFKDELKDGSSTYEIFWPHIHISCWHCNLRTLWVPNFFPYTIKKSQMKLFGCQRVLDLQYQFSRKILMGSKNTKGNQLPLEAFFQTPWNVNAQNNKPKFCYNKAVLQEHKCQTATKQLLFLT